MWWLDAWIELGTERQHGGGVPGPIPGSAIREWAAREWPGREDWAAGVMRFMDRAWFDELEYRRKLEDSQRKMKVPK